MITARTMKFLTDLKRNNDRGWFETNRTRYEEAREEFLAIVEGLIQRIGAFDPSVKGLDPRKCIFRIHKDTRFSKDKSPYKTNLGAHIGAFANKFHDRAGYYLHLEPGGGSMLAGGAYLPPPEWLGAIRRRIAADGKALRKILAHPGFKRHFGEMEGEKLKTAPQGYGADHPHLDLLRHKSFLAVRKLKDAEVLSPRFPMTAAGVFEALLPFDRFLNEALEA